MATAYRDMKTGRRGNDRVVSDMMLRAQVVLIALASLVSCRAGQEEAHADPVQPEKREKPESEHEIIAAIAVMKSSPPDPLIRSQLLELLEKPLTLAVGIEAADALGAWKGDDGVCDALIERVQQTRAGEGTELRLKCLWVFSFIAPFRKAVRLKPIFLDLDYAVAREAVRAAATIGSVRMLRPLIELLGELEASRDLAPGSRRSELMGPTRDAINQIWRVIESRPKLSSYIEANRAHAMRRADIRKIQAEEDNGNRRP